MSDSTETQPTQLSSTLKSIQGQVYQVRNPPFVSRVGEVLIFFLPLPLSTQAVGSVSSDPSWKEEGDELVEQAQKELEEAKARAKGEAAAERITGKVQS